MGFRNLTTEQISTSGDLQLEIVKETLSDGSEVYELVIADKADKQKVTIPTVTEKDAYRLLEAVEKYSS